MYLKVPKEFFDPPLLAKLAPSKRSVVNDQATLGVLL